MDLKEIRGLPPEVKEIMLECVATERDRRIVQAFLRGEPIMSIALCHGRGREVISLVVKKAARRANGIQEGRRNGNPVFPTLSVRAENCLWNMGLRNDRDVRDHWSLHDSTKMKQQPNFGRRSLEEIKAAYDLHEPPKPTKPVTYAQYLAAQRIVDRYMAQAGAA
ncbi:MAG: DNA-directed RNA polymerase subunit alpha C-terminal domain-containing protein [Pikeienuella sp.]